MAVIFGNLSVLPDLSSTRSVLADRKPRPFPSPADAVLGLGARRDPQIAFAPRGFEAQRAVVARGKANSEVNGGVDSDSDWEEEDVTASVEAEAAVKRWQKEMIQRAKELEEMKELEDEAEKILNEADRAVEGETEEEKGIRVRKELEKVAQEQAERRATAELMFDLGQKAYERGKYGRAVEFLEASLTIIPRPSLLGGEIQIWLAMAYDANNRHADCIELYRELEKSHPMPSIQKQAARLRYIAEAPKIKPSKEELLIFPPLFSGYDSEYAQWWPGKYDDEDKKKWTKSNKVSSSRDFLGDFIAWRPPIGWEKNRVFWVSLILWLGLVGAALFLQ